MQAIAGNPPKSGPPSHCQTEDGRQWNMTSGAQWDWHQSGTCRGISKSAVSSSISPKALGEDVPEHLEDGTSPELEHLYTKLVVWAAGLEELPRPAMPDALRRQHGRVGDNWKTLLAIAELAEGEWPRRALDAALAAIASEKQLTLIQRLL